MFRCFFFQAEDGIRDLVRSRGLGDVYKRQMQSVTARFVPLASDGDDSDAPTESDPGCGRPLVQLSLIHI